MKQADAGDRDRRLEWIDAARGIGIVAVVIGHVWTRGAPRDLMYAFHMPLFFLLSGYLFSPRPALPFALRHLRGQGLSYAAWLLIVLAMDLAIEGGRGHRPIFHDWPGDIGRLMIGGSELKGPFTVFWFVPCLLFARIVMNALGRRFDDILSWPWIFIAATSLALAYGLGAMTDFSPLGLLSVPMALVLLWLGAVWRRVEGRGVLLWVLLPVALAGLAWFPPVNMKAGDYGWPIASIAGAVAISLWLFRVARLPVIGSAPVRHLGRAALVIMYLHVPVIHYLTPYFGKPSLLALALLAPLGAYWLIGRSKKASALLLG